jgi:hypothetical protein
MYVDSLANGHEVGEIRLVAVLDVPDRYGGKAGHFGHIFRLKVLQDALLPDFFSDDGQEPFHFFVFHRLKRVNAATTKNIFCLIFVVDKFLYIFDSTILVYREWEAFAPNRMERRPLRGV